MVSTAICREKSKTSSATPLVNSSRVTVSNSGQIQPCGVRDCKDLGFRAQKPVRNTVWKRTLSALWTSPTFLCLRPRQYDKNRPKPTLYRLPAHKQCRCERSSLTSCTRHASVNSWKLLPTKKLTGSGISSDGISPPSSGSIEDDDGFVTIKAWPHSRSVGPRVRPKGGCHKTRL